MLQQHIRRMEPWDHSMPGHAGFASLALKRQECLSLQLLQRAYLVHVSLP